MHKMSVQLTTVLQIMLLSFIQLIQMACEDVICFFTFSYGLFVNMLLKNKEVIFIQSCVCVVLCIICYTNVKFTQMLNFNC